MEVVSTHEPSNLQKSPFKKSVAIGLTEEEAVKRLIEQKKQNQIRKTNSTGWTLFLSQFKNPLILLLAFAAVLSLILSEYSDSLIILTVLLTTGILGFLQERKANKAVQKLQALIYCTARVVRDGIEKEIPVDEVVKDDIVLLNAGDLIPADGFILDAKDLHINESLLTGESFPAEKFSPDKEGIALTNQNKVFKGTSVINGIGSIVCVETGNSTEMGKIITRLKQSEAPTAFEKGIFRFGYFLMKLTILFTGLILIANLLLHRPLIESLLFSLALTIGLTPELLPAILTVTLATGARRLANKKVIVKKLNAIQNLGEIDVLCSDKTGTITEGNVMLEKTIGGDGSENPKVLLYAYLNALFETGFTNPIDAAIKKIQNINVENYQKKDEVPYDFIRKRLSIVVNKEHKDIIITKGSFQNILDVCTNIELNEGKIVSIEEKRKDWLSRHEELSRQGLRVIAICYKDITGDPIINKDDECEMIFLGALVFSDPLKIGVKDAIEQLRHKGVALKIVTGDNKNVASHLANELNLSTNQILTGADLQKLSPDALKIRIAQTEVFAEILPVQKEWIVKALQAKGHCVGFLGDGINDVNALRAADVGISINNAVDVAKEAADFVLLDRDLLVIDDGIEEGRRTFVNTMKYVFVTTSANFGNMFSMAIFSLILPFLPLLPVQILLNNFLSDLPAVTIASDTVDPEQVEYPQKWDIHFIRRFMIVFGIQSSVFDFITYAVLRFGFKADAQTFRSAWFLESLLTQILILLVIRTQRPFFKSKPSLYLLMAAAIVLLFAVALPYSFLGSRFQLHPLPFSILSSLMLIVLSYISVAEVSKRFLVKRI